MKRLALLAALLVFAGCGKVTEVREPDVFVTGEAATDTRDAPNQQARGVRIANARIVFITHGQASDPFWTIVKRGLGDAQRQSGDRGLLPRAGPVLDRADAPLHRGGDRRPAGRDGRLAAGLRRAGAVDPRARSRPGSRS